MSTYEAIRAIIVEQLGAEPEAVTPAAAFVEDLKADSLDLVELIMTFEEKMGIEISDAEAEGIRTVGDAVAFVDARKAGAV